MAINCGAGELRGMQAYLFRTIFNTSQADHQSSKSTYTKHLHANQKMANTIYPIYPEILVAIFIFIYIFRRTWRLNEYSLPTNWPVIGMSPCFRKIHRFYEIMTGYLISSGGTFMFKGPWFCSDMNILVTADPVNVHYIGTRRFMQYPKGPSFKKYFDVLGDGIFNSDNDSWRVHRKTFEMLLRHGKFQQELANASRRKLENGMIPILDDAATHGKVIDLQDVFHRYTMDIIVSLTFGTDPNSLSVDMPPIPCGHAFEDAEEAIFYRHFTPAWISTLFKWLDVWVEKKMRKAWETVDDFIEPCVQKSLDDYKRKRTTTPFDGTTFDDLATTYFDANRDQEQEMQNPSDYFKYLRDLFLNLIFAGRDTTGAALTWFFWLIATHPEVEAKIREEIKTNLGVKQGQKWKFLNSEELNKLPYLHGALYESLRLYPAVPFGHKSPNEKDVVPSGHHLRPNTKVIISFYSMGRMESIWGKDCLEFKPERWINEKGGIKFQPSYKFTAFNSGPRICLGRDMALVQIKIVATAVIWNYNIRVVEGHKVQEANSVILTMKHGLKVRVSQDI